MGTTQDATARFFGSSVNTTNANTTTGAAIGVVLKAALLFALVAAMLAASAPQARAQASAAEVLELTKKIENLTGGTPGRHAGMRTRAEALETLRTTPRGWWRSTAAKWFRPTGETLRTQNSYGWWKHWAGEAGDDSVSIFRPPDRLGWAPKPTDTRRGRPRFHEGGHQGRPGKGSPLEVVGEAEDGLEALDECRKTSPDLVLMDLSMPNMGGIEATRRMKGHCPQTIVLVPTSHEDEGLMLEALRAGAAGYVLKGGSFAHLVGSVDGRRR